MERDQRIALKEAVDVAVRARLMKARGPYRPRGERERDEASAAPSFWMPVVRLGSATRGGLDGQRV